MSNCLIVRTKEKSDGKEKEKEKRERWCRGEKKEGKPEGESGMK